MSPLPEVLDDRYRLGRKLGQGGYGAVFLARDLSLDRPVAVKILELKSPSSVATERFAREAALAAKVLHAHVVPVLASGELPDRRPYLVFEYVEGTNLRARMKDAEPVPLALRIRWIGQLIAALGACHSQGVIHRDVKPENLFLLPNEDLKLGDFGLAYQADEMTRLTETGTFLGTLPYAAPEGFMGYPLDGRADLFAVACVAYELWYGECWRRDLRPPALFAEARSPRPKRPFEARLGQFPDLDDWLYRGLAPQREDRFADAAEMVSAFDTATTVEAYSGHEPDQIEATHRRGTPENSELPSISSGLRPRFESGPTAARSRAGLGLAVAILFAAGLALGQRASSASKAPEAPPEAAPFPSDASIRTDQWHDLERAVERLQPALAFIDYEDNPPPEYPVLDAFFDPVFGLRWRRFLAAAGTLAQDPEARADPRWDAVVIKTARAVPTQTARIRGVLEFLSMQALSYPGVPRSAQAASRFRALPAAIDDLRLACRDALAGPLSAAPLDGFLGAVAKFAEELEVVRSLLKSRAAELVPGVSPDRAQLLIEEIRWLTSPLLGKLVFEIDTEHRLVRDIVEWAQAYLEAQGATAANICADVLIFACRQIGRYGGDDRVGLVPAATELMASMEALGATRRFWLADAGLGLKGLSVAPGSRVKLDTLRERLRGYPRPDPVPSDPVRPDQ